MDDIFNAFFGGGGGRGRAGMGARPPGGRGAGPQPGNPEDMFHAFFGQGGRGRGQPGAGGNGAGQQPGPGGNLGGATVQGFFNNLMAAGGMMVDEDGWQVPTEDFLQQTHEPTVGPPPASRRVVAKMPEVEVTAEDLAFDANDSCCICMEDHVLGSRVLKLPCGHIFHRACVSSWLERHCTCPTCRFEVETEDLRYEADRRKRMKTRRLRFRQGELEKSSTIEVKRILESVGLPTAGCLEKSDMIARLLSSGFVDIVATDCPAASSPSSPGPLPTTASAALSTSGSVEGKGRPSMKLGELHGMPLAELRRLMGELGVSSVGYLEKTEMVQAVASSGLVHILAEETTVHVQGDGPMVQGGEDQAELDEEEVRMAQAAVASLSEPSTQPGARAHPSRQDVGAMGVGEVKRLMRSLGVSTDGCLEKADLVNRLVESGHVA